MRIAILLLLTFISGVAAAKANVLIFFKTQASLDNIDRDAPRTTRIRAIQTRLVQAAQSTQGPVLTLLRQNGVHHRSFYIANAIAASAVDDQLIRRLEQQAEVAHVTLDIPLPLKQLPAQGLIETASTIPKQISAIGVDKVWSDLGITGKGIVLGSIDSGVMWDHEALIERYRGRAGSSVHHDYNWHDAIHRPLSPGPADAQNCAFSSAEPCDDNGHGTHTVGTMVGEQVGRERFGVAPDAKWIGCRGLEKGWGSVGSYLECLEFMLAPFPRGGDPKITGRPDLAPHIINVSWICEDKEGCKKGDELREAVRALHAAGIMVVVAAGNDGPGCATINHAPAGYSEYIISVGAYDHRNDSIANFSSRGPSALDGGLAPIIVAPGVFLRSSVPDSGRGSYDFKSGTSMAAPHVAGSIALLWSAKPQLIGKIPETIALLARTASPRRASQTCGSYSGSQIPNAVYGHGLINTFAAVNGPSSER